MYTIYRAMTKAQWKILSSCIDWIADNSQDIHFLADNIDLDPQGFGAFFSFIYDPSLDVNATLIVDAGWDEEVQFYLTREPDLARTETPDQMLGVISTVKALQRNRRTITTTSLFKQAYRNRRVNVRNHLYGKDYSHAIHDEALPHAIFCGSVDAYINRFSQMNSRPFLNDFSGWRDTQAQRRFLNRKEQVRLEQRVAQRTKSTTPCSLCNSQVYALDGEVRVVYAGMDAHMQPVSEVRFICHDCLAELES